MTDSSNSPSCTNAPREKQPCVCIGYLFFCAIAAAVLVIGLLLISITERRAESIKRNALVEIAPKEMDAEKWRVNYPRQYDSWKRTQDTSFRTKFGGSATRDYLRATPANVVLFAGMAFSKEYNQARGHWFALEDVANSARVNEKTPASCWYCKSPDVPRLIEEIGLEKFASQKFNDLKGEVTHSVSCYDCHDEHTAALRIRRPAIIEGFKAQGKEMDAFSHQEMRSIACAQCHSTYHFSEGTNIVTFPWSKGTSAENIEAYYKEVGFSDWTHPISKVRMIKTRHPDYELFMTSTHAARGVSCADCHMPYRTEGAEKFSDHHWQSPLADMANACNVCHRWSEGDARAQVTLIQDRVQEGRTRVETALVLAHFDIGACIESGAMDEELAELRDLLRYAQMHWDLVASSNAMGFHAPQESQRILGTALDKAGQVRVGCARLLAKHGYSDEVLYPDVATKAKAQAVTELFINGKAPSLLKK